jgi:hypothetical protein
MNVEKLKKRCGYDGKPQQFKYGFDLACRELAQAKTVPEIQQSKQAEIDDLKAQLKAAHESRIEFVEYCRKIESNDFVLVPKEPTEKMLDAARRRQWDDLSSPLEDMDVLKYKAMIAAAQEPK